MKLIKTRKITKKHQAWIFQLGTFFARYPIYVHFNKSWLDHTTEFNANYSYKMKGVKPGTRPLQGLPTFKWYVRDTYEGLRRKFQPNAPYFYKHWK